MRDEPIKAYFFTLKGVISDVISYPILSYHFEIKRNGGFAMNNENSSITEKIGGVTYIVNVKSADNAKEPVEDYIKALITDEVLLLRFDVA